MRKLLETILEDLSTKDIFQFRVTCASCGKEYGNHMVRFSKAGIPPGSLSKQVIYDALYEQEHRDARYAAISSAAEHMNYCPICKQLVCNECFLICEDLDMCKHCAENLKQQGQPVTSNLIDAVII